MTMPTCTKAEREYLDVSLEYAPGGLLDDSCINAFKDFCAELRAAVVVKPEATIGLTVTDWREQERLLKARIAELESALAEERAKPKEGAVRFVAECEGGSRAWLVLKQTVQWSSGYQSLRLGGDAAESLAREYAAKLQAEHDAKAGQP